MGGFGYSRPSKPPQPPPAKIPPSTPTPSPTPPHRALRLVQQREPLPHHRLRQLHHQLQQVADALARDGAGGDDVYVPLWGGWEGRAVQGFVWGVDRGERWVVGGEGCGVAGGCLAAARPGPGGAAIPQAGALSPPAPKVDTHLRGSGFFQ